ncbi:tetrahydrodipicolinate N-succinyltransferase N-terminal domain-containing protein [Curvibacter gracilis]|uniref:tetrahydrodipicolinate N-succinyltransferase N-terminal domain-containing protein n=1 Tax=Curvibacter gracilis TaxID=230310 RepID=UPI000487A173|nr:tetrahydrodipicolinate N-succinyltransferase N-terminal domain-containing protein [Curvibacter gracilis]
MSQTTQDYPQDADAFKRIVSDYQATAAYKNPILFAVGRQVYTANRTLASVRYPVVNGPGQNTGSAAILMKVLGIEPTGVQNVVLSAAQLAEALRYFAPFVNDGKQHPNLVALQQAAAQLAAAPAGAASEIVATFIFDDIDPQGVEDSTLKLYGLSNRHFKPNQLNLTKIFTKFPNVAWVGDVPMDAAEIDQALLGAAFGNTEFAPHMVDKFPLYVHRINAVKMGVRITDQHKVRLGAYLGEGTTLMPGASYINFNAGTEGPSMVEGRISSSVFVGAGTDLGGGASTLGVLSGGNNTPISVGRNCLLEVNSALGIPVGDAVILAAEVALMASSLVKVDVEGHPLNGKTVKAIELVGINAVTFRRHNQTGGLEVVRTRRNIDFAKKLDNGEDILNGDLHKN